MTAPLMPETPRRAVPVDFGAPSRPPLVAPPPDDDKRFRIYVIREHATGMEYVGVTGQPLHARYLGHRNDALRHKRRRPGGLAEAIRRAVASGLVYREAFTVRLVAASDDPGEARSLEAAWIARLGTAIPAGYNRMPGGSSLGGPANAMPILLDHPDRGLVSYKSLSNAIADVNREHQLAGRRSLGLGTVHARLCMGWPAAEALGLRPHVDSRSLRAAPVLWEGREHRTLRAIADETGINPETLRSRRYRAEQFGAGIDVSLDRRRGQSGARPTARSCRIRIPTADGVSHLTPEAFGRCHGLSKSTVTWRWRQLEREDREPSRMPVPELHAYLRAPQDRRIMIELRITPDRVWRGGVRELVRRVLADTALEQARVDRIGASSIRARLRTAPGWPGSPSPEDVRWAFGLRIRPRRG